MHTNTALDYEIAALRAGREHLESLHTVLRVQIINTWLAANRNHLKAPDVRRYMVMYRTHCDEQMLDCIDEIIERYIDTPFNK